MKPKVFKLFVTPVYPYGDDHYFHEMIAVAEGLQELGYKVIGNTNYWLLPETKSYLIQEDATSDYDVAIYDYRYVTSFAHLLFRSNGDGFDRSKVHILIDRNDWISPIWTRKEYRIFDLIFSGNLYDHLRYPTNLRPWAIGLTKRIMTSVDRFYDNSLKVDEVIGHNFRVPQNLRKELLEGLENQKLKFPLQNKVTTPLSEQELKTTEAEADRAYWKMTTRRHDPKFYRMLNDVLLFLTFGGYWEYRPILYQPYSIWAKIRRRPYIILEKFLQRLGKDVSPARFLFQHDNFRFFEVLYSRACPVNVNLSLWKFRLPAMPLPDQHYLSIDRFDFRGFAEKVHKLSKNEIQRLGEEGRSFAKEHYSPVGQAKYLLKELEALHVSRP